MFRRTPVLRRLGPDIGRVPLTDEVRSLGDASEIASGEVSQKTSAGHQRPYQSETGKPLWPLGALLTLLGATIGAFGSDHAPAAAEQRGPASLTPDVEEVIVVAQRLKKGAIPTQMVIVQTYSVRRRGIRLYEEQRYGEALPLLLLAAKRGFKWPQAMAGDILLHGRGEVGRDLESGIGWLGVAAAPRTEPEIDTYFRHALAEFPERQRMEALAVVHRYRDRWSSEDWRVSCRRNVSSGPGVSQVDSLRLRRQLRCTFMDEVPVCRAPYLDPFFFELTGGITLGEQMLWECPPVAW